MGSLRTTTICKVETRLGELAVSELAAGAIGKDTTRSRYKRMKLLEAYWALTYVFDDDEVKIINTFITGI